MSCDVFISYASTDRKAAEELNARLVKAGFSVWFDKESVKPGSNWFEEIERARNDCHILIPLLTDHWRNSEWTRFETYPAREIIPILLQGEVTKQLPEPLRHLHAVTIDLECSDNYEWERLFDSIREKLRRKKSGAPTVKSNEVAVVGVPPQESWFFRDREEPIHKLHQLMRDPRVKFISIVGRGGIGKTALLCKLCTEIETGKFRLSEIDRSVDGLIHVNCGPNNRPTVEQIFQDVGTLLGEPHADELRQRWKDTSRSLIDKTQFLLSTLEKKGSHLLILDNFEDALDGKNFIADKDLQAFVDLCLVTPSALRIIATSREQVVLGVNGLRAARTVLLGEGLPETDGVAFLRELDPEGDRGLRDADEVVLGDIVRRCHGNPRALEAVAGLLSDEMEINRLLRNTALFTEEVVDNLIAEHYRRVPDDQRRVVESLAVYDKPVPASAISFMLSPLFPRIDVDACLRLLVRNYFARYHRERDTYELHPLDRNHAYNKLSTSSDAVTRQSMHHRAAMYWQSICKPKSDWKSIEDLQPLLDTFDHLVRAESFDAACNLITTFDFDYLSRWGRPLLIIEKHSMLRGKIMDLRRQRENLSSLGIAHRMTGEVETAIAFHSQALEIGSDLFRLENGPLLNNLGWSYTVVGELDQAVDCYLRAYNIALETNNARGIGVRLGNLGIAFELLGEMEKAEDCFARARRHAIEQQYTRAELASLDNLGWLFLHTKKFPEAIEVFERAVEIGANLRESENHCHALIGLGSAFHHGGQLDAARTSYAKAFELQCSFYGYMSLIKLGVVHLEQDKSDVARSCLENGIECCQNLLDKTPRLYDARYHLALGQIANGQQPEGLASYRQALQACSARGVVNAALMNLQLLERVGARVASVAEARKLLQAVT